MVGTGVVAVLVLPVVEAVVELEVRVLLADGAVELVEPGVELFVPDHVHVAALAGAVVPGVAAADHVDVEVGQGLLQRDQRVFHVELRAEQSLLLPAHGQEEDAVLQAVAVLRGHREYPRQLQQGRGAGAVVVGSAVDRRVAHAQMIIMRADHDATPPAVGAGQEVRDVLPEQGRVSLRQCRRASATGRAARVRGAPDAPPAARGIHAPRPGETGPRRLPSRSKRCAWRENPVRVYASPCRRVPAARGPRQRDAR